MGRLTARVLSLPMMIAALAAYVTLHSPLRAVLVRLAGGAGRSTYFDEGLVAGFSGDALAALILIGAALVAAAVVARRCAVDSYERPIVFGVSAFGFVVVAAGYVGALAACTGTSLLRPPVGPLFASVPALMTVAIAVARGWKPSFRIDLPSMHGAVIPLGLLAVALLAASAGVSVIRPPTGFDALAYHAPMSVYLWRDGNLVSYLDRAPYGFALAQPGAAELWFGLLRIAGGEALANLGQLPFSLLGAAAIHAFSRRAGFRGAAAWLGSVAFLLAPMVAVQIGIQVTDLAAAALLMSACALACAPVARWTRSRWTLFAVTLGLAVTVKLAALPAAAGAIVFVVIAAIGRERRNWPRLAVAGAACALAFAITVGPWWGRNAVRYGNPLYPAALPWIGRGVVVGDFQQKDDRFVPTRAAWPLYPLLETHSEESGLGALFLITALPGVGVAVRRRRRRPFWLFAVVSAVSMPAWWMLTQHEPRHLLVVWGLAFAFVPWSLVLVARRLRPAALVVVVLAAGFSALVTVDAALRPRVHQPADRAHFYDQVWGIDPVVAGRPGSDAILYNTGYANLSYAGDYPLLGPDLTRRLLTVDANVSTSDIVALMRRQSVSYAYVPAAAADQDIVRAKYDARLFDLDHVSTVSSSDGSQTMRYLFRLRAPAAPLAWAKEPHR